MVDLLLGGGKYECTMLFHVVFETFTAVFQALAHFFAMEGRLNVDLFFTRPCHLAIAQLVERRTVVEIYKD